MIRISYNDCPSVVHNLLRFFKTKFGFHSNLYFYKIIFVRFKTYATLKTIQSIDWNLD